MHLDGIGGKIGDVIKSLLRALSCDMTCVLIIALLVVVLMYNLPLSFSGRLIILSLGVTCSLRSYYFGSRTTLQSLLCIGMNWWTLKAINRAWDQRLSVISIICRYWIATKFAFSKLQRKLEKTFSHNFIRVC